MARCSVPKTASAYLHEMSWVLFAGVSALFATIFRLRMVVTPGSDLSEHIKYAKQIHGFTDITSPHFLFQLLLKALHAVTPFSWETATALILGFCYGGMALLLRWELQRRAPAIGTALSTAWAVAILLASHVFLLTLFTPNFYTGYFVPTSYHNPTQQLNKLLALAIWVIFFRSVAGRGEREGLGAAAALSALCLLSAVAKPSFLIAFIPLVGLLAGVAALRGKWFSVIDMAVIIVPTMIVLLLQGWLTYARHGSVDGIEFAPFAVRAPLEVVRKLPFSLILPVTVTALFWKRARQQPTFLAAWALFIVGLAYALLLAESGPRKLAGNFFWTAQTAIFLLYVESAFLIAEQRMSGLRYRFALAVVALHVVFGIIFICANAGWNAEAYL